MIISDIEKELNTLKASNEALKSLLDARTRELINIQSVSIQNTYTIMKELTILNTKIKELKNSQILMSNNVFLGMCIIIISLIFDYFRR